MKNSGNNSFELTIKSSTDNLAVIRDFIREKAEKKEVSEEIIEKIMLAVDEAVSNIMRHAYRSATDKDIKFKIRFSDTECTITMIDYGISFDPEAVESPNMEQYLKERRVGGLGIHLMKMLMDKVEYRPLAGGENQLTLKKSLET